ncbi:hypothetical protein SSPO_084470 [Streptomyces antimycoticus]|uniref:Uncharacterized protein n=1 Tax=Streptomyces antimycoticus TaxID=68175 RepID=A0A499V9Q2_9ACTN|nr:hypothetical protein SSPO_084470 [Streptomyces antimycoticus]
MSGSVEEKAMCPASQSLHPTTDNRRERVRIYLRVPRRRRSWVRVPGGDQERSYERLRNLTIVVLRWLPY